MGSVASALSAVNSDIPVLRSYAALAEKSTGKTPASLSSLATLYTTAQEARWLDDDRFSIGRWDGSITTYKLNSGSATTICITAAAAERGSGGVRMITALPDGFFASSSGARHIDVWHMDQPSVAAFQASYDPALQSASFRTTVHQRFRIANCRWT